MRLARANSCSANLPGGQIQQGGIMGGSLRVRPDRAFSVTKTLHRFPALPERFRAPGKATSVTETLRCFSLFCMHHPFLACAAQ